MEAMAEQPVLVFGLGISLVMFCTSMVHGLFEKGLTATFEHAKILFFFLLMQAQLHTRTRLKLYTAVVALIITIPIILAVLNYHEYVHIAEFQAAKEKAEKTRLALGMEATKEMEEELQRLGTTGNFADPNDVCEIVNFAIIFSLCGLFDRGGGCSRVLWLAPLALFGHAQTLTRSRGGFLGLMVGLAVLFVSRFGMRKAVIAGALTLPVVLVFFAGRQTSIDVKKGTAQERVQLWDDAFANMRDSPLLGVGPGEFTRAHHLAAHNAFVHLCAELGLLAGSFYAGQYFYCLKNLKDLGAAGVILPDPEMRRLHPFVLASVASFATSEMSITNPLSLITYVILGLATAFIRLADRRPPLPDFFLTGSLFRRAILCCGLMLVALYLFVKTSVQY